MQVKSFDYNFLALVKSNPNKNFIFFYPPYSIITFKDWAEKDILFDIMKFKLYVNEEFSKLKNVILYDFQSAIDITTNLDNYKDFCRAYREGMQEYKAYCKREEIRYRRFWRKLPSCWEQQSRRLYVSLCGNIAQRS